MHLYKWIYNPMSIEMTYAITCVGLYSNVGILKPKYHIKLNLEDLSS